MQIRKQRLLLAGAMLLLLLATGGYLWIKRPNLPDVESPKVINTEEKPVASSEVATDPSRDWSERVEAARSLPTSMGDEELERLLAFLEAQLPSTGRENSFLAINEVMEQLRLKGRATGKYALALSRLIRNPDAEPVVRDYAVQHAVRWMMDAASAAGNGSQSDALAESSGPLLLESIGALLSEPGIEQETGWGTALNALRELQKSYSKPEAIEIAFSSVSERILTIASGESTASPANRVAAIQCLPHLPVQERSLSVIRTLCFNEQVDVAARLPAIAVLGTIGEPADVPSVEQLASGGSHLRFAAKSALARLQSRHLPARE